MKKILISILLAIFCLSSSLFAKQFQKKKIDKQTFVYSIKNKDTLRLDKYTLLSSKGRKPCVLFVFGGGFHAGARNEACYTKYFDYLVDKGLTVVSIDYRLGLKQLSEVKNPMESLSIPQMIGMLGSSVNTAVEDLFSATKYLINNADKLGIDPKNIIVSGSSAGAITVLEGEYLISNAMAQALPLGFNYSGVMSYAGAIFGMGGNLNWKSKPCPILMFHGDADSNVPFNCLEMDNFGLYGSKYISKSLSKIQSPYEFYMVKNATHEMAIKPMYDYLPEIYDFINNYVINKKKIMKNIQIEEIGGKSQVNKRFEIMDYLQSNFPSFKK